MCRRKILQRRANGLLDVPCRIVLSCQRDCSNPMLCRKVHVQQWARFLFELQRWLHLPCWFDNSQSRWIRMPSWILVRVRRHDGHHDALYCRDVWNRDPGNVGSVRMYQLPSRLLLPEFWYERDLVAAGMPARILLPNWDDFWSASLHCLSCPMGRYCPAGSANANLLCPQGYYCPQQTGSPTDPSPPVKCPAGTYSGTRLGLTAPSDCITCDPGGYCQLGAQQPTPCSPGRFNPNFAASTSAACQQCTPGFACPLTGQTTVYHSCSPGYYCPGGSTSPTGNPCPAGTFTDATNATSANDSDQEALRCWVLLHSKHPNANKLSMPTWDVLQFHHSVVRFPMQCLPGRPLVCRRANGPERDLLRWVLLSSEFDGAKPLPVPIGHVFHTDEPDGQQRVHTCAGWILRERNGVDPLLAVSYQDVRERVWYDECVPCIWQADILFVVPSRIQMPFSGASDTDPMSCGFVLSFKFLVVHNVSCWILL
ncbi:unnamed protein product (mitochondrion) [Plasmodiophora brassicae]|uniref:Tyrosine-protein kinase ephrin type A/B receptor-like domain-containing protein n=1 Tax=Plasmodiophora brassicae TaxID=37360 RepID=A0A3P3Y3C7_PLABS|nr:unnamed protein product [Plasmodiophora brassicae]